jgi:hypothetical protein
MCVIDRQDAAFWERVRCAEDPNICWEWIGYRNTNGYGCVFDKTARRMVRAHRWAYERWVGPIPDGLQIDHLCRNKRCVNPAHLEPVTLVENVLRGESPWAQRRRQTHCKNGHAFSPENTHISRLRGTRRCRKCAAAYMAARYARLKATPCA